MWCSTLGCIVTFILSHRSAARRGATSDKSAPDRVLSNNSLASSPFITWSTSAWAA
jgi:hypothetical protein